MSREIKRIFDLHLNRALEKNILTDRRSFGVMKIIFSRNENRT